MWFILLLLNVLSIFAQENIDKVTYHITSKTDCVVDTTPSDSTENHKYDHNEMALDVGTKVSKFYSMHEVKHDKWLEYTIKHGGEATKDNTVTQRGSVFWTITRKIYS